MDCECEFSPYEDDEKGDESYHFLRQCETCGAKWYSLHCPHEETQKPCPNGHVNPSK